MRCPCHCWRPLERRPVDDTLTIPAVPRATPQYGWSGTRCGSVAAGDHPSGCGFSRCPSGSRRGARAIEDLVIYKLVASRPRDLDDAEALLALHGSAMNLSRVRKVVAEFSALLEDDERPRAPERLIHRADLAP